MSALGNLLDRLLTALLRRASPALGRGSPVLDLHGLGVKDALAATERFVRDAATDGHRDVRIIYGKGRGSPGGHGILREVVPRWLAKEGHRWVESASPDPDARGEDGAMRVRLRPGGDA